MSMNNIYYGSDLKTGQIWEGLRVKVLKVPWHSLVWFPGSIPKHNIIVRMTILNRLPARVRLLKMGLRIENDKYVLCGAEAEIMNHLFFDCGFTRELWGDILTLCGVTRRDIKEVIQIRLKGWAISRVDPRNDSLCVKWGIS
ncbi:hypothetical protein F3Y22_tig00110379pilonHSYRG00013 [Hibiscus syriacus]|uniref:Reverse transcriptase zinc-binding domain-containing protein n=1 Tax=Hibiscus syriacus TaxID=106335 RepID=A0A6A3ASH3_HIBSY|nr:hypothetical protein F3Y22_tig00110379pilonHSYRG00013 [Hibiscus syriacus]